MSSNAMPLLNGQVFGSPVIDSLWRFPARSRVLRYEIDNFDVRNVHFDCHLVAVALQPEPVIAFRRIDDQRRQEVIVPGGAIVVPQGALHDSRVPHRGIFIMAGVSTQTLQETADMLDMPVLPSLLPRFPEQRDDELAALLSFATNIAQLGDLGRSVELDTCLHRLTVRLLSSYSTRSATRTTLNLGLAPLQLKRVTDYIHAHLAMPLSIDVMAAEARLSRHHFLRQFRRATGKTPGQFVIELRMALARRQLASSTEPIANVAAQCGFSTEAHFSHTFRARFGQTPSQFRQNVRLTCSPPTVPA